MSCTPRTEPEFESLLRAFLESGQEDAFALSEWLPALSDRDFARMFERLEAALTLEEDDTLSDEELVDLIRTAIAVHGAEGGRQSVDSLLNDVERLLLRFQRIVELELMRREGLFVLNSPIRMLDEFAPDIELTAKGLGKLACRRWLNATLTERVLQ